MNIRDVKNQLWSTLYADFMICESCKIVDRDHKRIQVGYKCPNCGVPSNAAMRYFDHGVLSLIDLMQEFYQLKQGVYKESDAPIKREKSGHKLAIVIFFCALTEVLLQHFLEQLMYKSGLEYKIKYRLLDDNRFIKQRIDKLFPALTGVKWNESLKKISENVELDYIETIKFYKKASKARNLFLHEGNKYAIPQNMPEQCIDHIWPLICLFISLHNEHIAKNVIKKTK
jgi:hypothetical protein